MFPHCLPMGKWWGNKITNNMITTAIVFDHRGRTKKGAEGPLEVRLTIERKPYYINTGVRVREKQWQFDKVVQHPQADALNNRLGILLGRIMDKVNDCLSSGKEVNVAQIRQEIWTSPTDYAFMDWVRDTIPLLNLKPNSMKHYKTLQLRLIEYGELKKWNDLTIEKIIKWDKWLHELQGRNGKILQSSVHIYHKDMKALLERAVRMGKLAQNPYSLLKGEFPKGENENTEYLTEEEMRKIVEFKPTPGTWMERAKDLFVFMMYTGLSYSDAQAFDIKRYKLVEFRDKITGHKTKQWISTGNRIKTGEAFVSHLLPPAVAVLEKYDMQTPKILNAVFNRELKTIGMALGIQTRMHTHLARHTFATWMLRNGVRLENVGKMLGQSNIRTTQRYAKVLAESVHEDFQMMGKKLISTEKRRAQQQEKRRAQQEEKRRAQRQRKTSIQSNKKKRYNNKRSGD